jgi:CBS domain-containing protein
MVQMQKILLKDIMVTDPETVDIYEDFAVSWDIFRLRQIRHLPVLMNDRLLVGIFTLRDLFRIISPRKSTKGALVYDVDELNKYQMKDEMTKDVVSLHEEDTLGMAIDLMVNNKIGCIPIIDDTTYLKGIITRADALREVAKYFV